MSDKLLFVYNADGGIFSGVEDYFHKIIKPQTYQCRLCAITYGTLGMKAEWKRFIEEQDMPVEFLHKDEFIKQYPDTKARFPSAYILRDSDIIPFITVEEMNSFKTLDELMEAVRAGFKTEIGE